MKRRLWTWLLIASVGGCMHTVSQVEAPSSPAPDTPHVDVPDVSAPPVSPYHVMPTPAVPEVAKETRLPPVPGLDCSLAPPDLRMPEPPLEPSGESPIQPVSAKAPVPEEPLQAALRCFFDNRPAEAVRLLNQYDKASQELLLCLLPLAVPLTQTDLQHANPQEVDALLDQLNAVAAPLKQRAPLKLGTVCFCERVRQFGVYDPLGDNPALRPGDEVHIYVELKNFSTVSDPSGHKVPLDGKLEVLDYAGKTLVRQGNTLESDSLSPRQDLFVRFPFPVPHRLPQGSYTVRITIEDLVTHRKVSRSLDFRIQPRDIARGG